MALDGIGGVRPGQPPAGVRAPFGDIALTNAQALGAKLRSGEIVSARVGADLGSGNVSLTVRGQTVVATSQLPLKPDSIVRLMVQSAGDQPVLRILGSPPSELANLSTPAARASALGLPSTPLVGVALNAFEEAGAPLDSARLRDAVTQLQRVPTNEIPQRAQALALLAQAGLPTTPPFVALAQRSATGVLPNPAAALAELQRATQIVSVATPAGVTGRSIAAVATPSVGLSAPVPSAPGILPTTPSATSTVALNPASATPVTFSSTPATVIQSAGTATPASVVANAGTPVVSQLPGALSQLPGQAPAYGGQTAGARVAGSIDQLGADAATTSSTTSSTSTSATNAAAKAITSSTSVSVPSPASSAAAAALPTSSTTASVSTAPLPLAAGAPVPGSAVPATALVLPVIPTATTLAGTIVPDLARGGATAVLQALVLVGVRPRDTGEQLQTKLEPTLLHRLDVPIEEGEAIRASIDTSTRQPPQTPLDAAVVQVMREQAAETVVKPKALLDYDVVLGLPLQIQGQPLPARLAVAERQTSGGRATFLRVDAELTHLGPLSVRISGIENGPMAITVLAVGPALQALAEALPDLNESLRELGLTAGVRIADLAEDLDHD